MRWGLDAFFCVSKARNCQKNAPKLLRQPLCRLSWILRVYRDRWRLCQNFYQSFCIDFLTFLLKIPILQTHYNRIIALFRSPPPWASPGHSWGGRGYLFRNFVLLYLILRTCNLEGLCPFRSLSSEKPEISTFRLQVRKVALRRTNFSKRCPRPSQQSPALTQGGRDRNNAIIWGVIYL